MFKLNVCLLMLLSLKLQVPVFTTGSWIEMSMHVLPYVTYRVKFCQHLFSSMVFIIWKWYRRKPFPTFYCKFNLCCNSALQVSGMVNMEHESEYVICLGSLFLLYYLVICLICFNFPTSSIQTFVFLDTFVSIVLLSSWNSRESRN